MNDQLLRDSAGRQGRAQDLGGGGGAWLGGCSLQSQQSTGSQKGAIYMMGFRFWSHQEKPPPKERREGGREGGHITDKLQFPHGMSGLDSSRSRLDSG